MRNKREAHKKTGPAPRLQFLSSSTGGDGFLNSIVSGERLSNVSEIVRELIQNSTDAAREAGRSKAMVDFVLDEFIPAQIPGIDDYKDALKYCQETHKSIENCEATIEKMRHQLERERIPALSVLDNGIGLNPDRMNRLLGDGITSKTQDWSNSGGSYGVGHVTAFGASDMRYILYGGVTSDNKKTMSGHAILASHFPPPPPLQFSS